MVQDSEKSKTIYTTSWWRSLPWCLHMPPASKFMVTRLILLPPKSWEPRFTPVIRESLSSQLESLNELIANLKEGLDASTQNSNADKEYREQVAGAFIRQWKINRALEGQYAGRVIFQQGGLEPLDTYSKNHKQLTTRMKADPSHSKRFAQGENY
jgi:hypothetical protein